MTTPANQVGEALAEQFGRMVRRDGGTVTFLGADGDVLRMAYRAGADENCADDSCVMPHLDLQELMSQTLARRAEHLRVVVEPGP